MGRCALVAACLLGGLSEMGSVNLRVARVAPDAIQNGVLSAGSQALGANLAENPEWAPTGGDTKLYEEAGMIPPVFMWDIQEGSRARLRPWEKLDEMYGSGSGSGSGAGGEAHGSGTQHDDLSIQTYPLPPVEPKTMPPILPFAQIDTLTSSVLIPPPPATHYENITNDTVSETNRTDEPMPFEDPPMDIMPPPDPHPSVDLSVFQRQDSLNPLCDSCMSIIMERNGLVGSACNTVPNNVREVCLQVKAMYDNDQVVHALVNNGCVDKTSTLPTRMPPKGCPPLVVCNIMQSRSGGPMCGKRWRGWGDFIPKDAIRFAHLRGSTESVEEILSGPPFAPPPRLGGAYAGGNKYCSLCADIFNNLQFSPGSVELTGVGPNLTNSTYISWRARMRDHVAAASHAFSDGTPVAENSHDYRYIPNRPVKGDTVAGMFTVAQACRGQPLSMRDECRNFAHAIIHIANDNKPGSLMENITSCIDITLEGEQYEVPNPNVPVPKARPPGTCPGLLACNLVPSNGGSPMCGDRIGQWAIFGGAEGAEAPGDDDFDGHLRKQLKLMLQKRAKQRQRMRNIRITEHLRSGTGLYEK